MHTGYSQNGKLQALLRSALFWIGFFALFFLTRFVVGMIGKNGSAGQWSGALILTLALIGWTRACQRMERRSLNPGITFSKGSIPRAIFGFVFAVPLCGFSLISLEWLLHGVEFGVARPDIAPVLTSAALFLVLAAYEEIGFRGYPLARLLPSFGIWPTLLLIAPMFALYHLAMGWPLFQAAVGTGVGSLFFGMAAIAPRRGLAFPIGVHAGWNFTTWCLTSGNGPWKMTFPPYLAPRVQSVGMVMYVTCMMAGTVLLWLWGPRRVGREHLPTVFRKSSLS